MSDLLTLDMSKAERIAFGTTEQAGKPRWTEIAVYYFPRAPFGGKRWLAETHGLSSIPGERTRTQRLRAGTLERALKLIDQTGDIGIIVAETAREWAEDNRRLVEAGTHRPFTAQTDEEALAWLYGEPDPGRTLGSMLARDMGIGESTVRMQLANGTDVKVPLRAILPFVDREAFSPGITRLVEEAARG